MREIDNIINEDTFLRRTPMRSRTNKKSGFTLVELAIVMIVIGLLIGGIFSGIKLVENAQVSKTIQDLKAIESAALTFRDTYGRLPGDLRNPNIRLANCNDAPCATTGNGNRVLEPANFTGPIADNSEVFLFSHHLQASGLINLAVQNTLNMDFGLGQADSPIGGGYRIANAGANMPWGLCTNNFVQNAAIWIGVNQPSAFLDGLSSNAPCTSIRAIDTKIDDGLPHMGELTAGWGCDPVTCTGPYQAGSTIGVAMYDFRGF
jgi:prepilin-type N-terminal cleavage/methylation domain-containing protein